MRRGDPLILLPDDPRYPKLCEDPSRGRLSCKKPRWALCIGGGDCVWDDVLAFEAIYGGQWDGLVIAANDIGCHWPRELDHWVSLHPEHFPSWTALRKQYQFADGYALWGGRVPVAGTDYLMEAWSGGSSGMFAVQCAIEIGCTRVVCCGIPMTQTPHFKETHEKFHSIWIAANAHFGSWRRCLDRFGDNVRSMSGRTQELLGAPTLEWLVSKPYERRTVVDGRRSLGEVSSKEGT